MVYDAKRKMIFIAYFDSLKEDAFKLNFVLLIKKRISVFGCPTFKNNREVNTLSEFIEETDFIRCGVVKDDENFHFSTLSYDYYTQYSLPM